MQIKGLRGLKAHQRSCRTLFGLQNNILEGIEYNQSENSDVSDIDIENQINSLLPDVKAGVKLPKTDNHWNIANSYFKSTLPVSSIDIEDLNATIKCMNETIYNYFKDDYGTVETNTYKIYHEKYKEFNPIQDGGTMCPPPYRFFPCCAETACSRLMKLSDF